MSLVPVPSEQSGATCATCGAALVADQRYCLSCGHPSSPVRLAFLDVLQGEQARSTPPGQQAWLAQGAIDVAPVGYAPLYGQQGASGWIRRYSGLLGLLSVLLLCLIAGLLVGHWVTQSNKAPAPQVVKIEGLSGLAAAPASTTTTSTTPTETPASDKPSAKQEKEEAEAGAKETKAEKAPPPKPVKVTPTKLKKLTQTSGKKHQEEINELGAQPIETG